jgi:hypothetical protein
MLRTLYAFLLAYVTIIHSLVGHVKSQWAKYVMNLQPTIIDNIMPKSFVDMIEEEFMGYCIPWVHLKDIAIDSQQLPSMLAQGIVTEPNPGFINVIYKNGQSQGRFWDLARPIALEAMSRINMPARNFGNCRSFMSTSTASTRPHDVAHVDVNFPHIVVLYYVNDSTGPTYLFNQRYEEGNPQFWLDDSSLEVAFKIEPRKGRVVIFDGLQFHASSRPQSGSRCVINFNVLLG